MKTKLAMLGAFVLLALTVATFGGTPASAHTPKVSATCEGGVSLNLKSYEPPNSVDSVNNDAHIYMDGVFVNTIPFATELVTTIAWPTQAASHTYKVVIDANIVKGDATKWDSVHEGSVDGCEPPVPEPVCVENAFFDQAGAITMWEITWGRQNTDTNGVPTFTQDSYGGMTGINGGGIPAYFTPSWKWLYVTPANVANGRVVTYDFADGTRITATVSGTEEGCPQVEWVTGRIPAPEDLRTQTYQVLTNCDTKVVTTITTETVTKFVWEDGEYVEGAPVVTTRRDYRDMTPDELANCETPPATTVPPTVPPVTVPEVPVPPVAPPTTQAPEIPTVPDTTVAAVVDVGTPVTATVTPANKPLPETGSNATSLFLLLGGLLLIAGTGTALAARRR